MRIVTSILVLISAIFCLALVASEHQVTVYGAGAQSAHFFGLMKPLGPLIEHINTVTARIGILLSSPATSIIGIDPSIYVLRWFGALTPFIFSILLRFVPNPFNAQTKAKRRKSLADSIDIESYANAHNGAFNTVRKYQMK